jgi:hypothetical protein
MPTKFSENVDFIWPLPDSPLGCLVIAK